MDDHPSVRQRRRAAFLKELGVEERSIPELLTYGEALIDDVQGAELQQLPMEDELFVETWERYASEAESEGAWKVLSRHLMQLSFPIDSTLAESEEYIAATRRGVRPAVPAPPRVVGSISIELHPTPAGRIPVIAMENREDFITIVRALLRKNRADPIPESMGASMVAGYTNWERVDRYRERWEQSNPFGDWGAAFKEMAKDKSLYQDRFILLSDGAYSGIAADMIGESDSEWKSTSVNLRREHECVHYFTRRVLGSMRNSLLDELVADAVAVREATGNVRGDWLKAFFGIEGWPEYRKGGRLENYVPETLTGCFDHLTNLMNLAIDNVARVDSEDGPISSWSSLVFMLAMCSCSLDELARPDGLQLLQESGIELAKHVG